MVLDIFRIIQDEQPAFRQIVQHAGLWVQIGQVKGDVIERALVTQVLEVALPAFLGIVMQH